MRTVLLSIISLVSPAQLGFGFDAAVGAEHWHQGPSGPPAPPNPPPPSALVECDAGIRTSPIWPAFVPQPELGPGHYHVSVQVLFRTWIPYGRMALEWAPKTPHIGKVSDGAKVIALADLPEDEASSLRSVPATVLELRKDRPALRCSTGSADTAMDVACVLIEGTIGVGATTTPRVRVRCLPGSRTASNFVESMSVQLDEAAMHSASSPTLHMSEAEQSAHAAQALPREKLLSSRCPLDESPLDGYSVSAVDPHTKLAEARVLLRSWVEGSLVSLLYPGVTEAPGTPARTPPHHPRACTRTLHVRGTVEAQPRTRSPVMHGAGVCVRVYVYTVRVHTKVEPPRVCGRLCGRGCLSPVGWRPCVHACCARRRRRARRVTPRAVCRAACLSAV